MAAKLIPESIREVLEYRPDTGDLIWINCFFKSKIGTPAGGLDDEGYRIIRHKNSQYKAHRVAYFLMTGKQPPEKIDHEDNDPSNNKWNNLRPSDAVRNGANQARQKRGICGVRLDKGRYWKACIQSRGKMIYLYHGPDFFEACCARKSAENRFHRSIQKMPGV